MVIAIIAILAAMLLPALTAAKNRAQRTIDISNHHQLLVSMQLYAGDNYEVLPTPGWDTAAPCWAHGANLPAGGAGTLAGYNSILPQQQAVARNGQLFRYMKTYAILMCPADKRDGLFFQRNVYISSYVYNGAISGFSSGQPGKLSNFKPDRILQWETDEKTPFFFNDCSSFPDEGISGRHGKGATVGVMDGSTRSVNVAEWYKNNYAGAAGARGAGIPANMLPNVVWYNPRRANGLP